MPQGPEEETKPECMAAAIIYWRKPILEAREARFNKKSCSINNCTSATTLVAAAFTHSSCQARQKTRGSLHFNQFSLSYSHTPWQWQWQCVGARAMDDPSSDLWDDRSAISVFGSCASVRLHCNKFDSGVQQMLGLTGDGVNFSRSSCCRMAGYVRSC